MKPDDGPSVETPSRPPVGTSWRRLVLALLVVAVAAVFLRGGRVERIETGLVYGQADGQILRLDVYRPKEPASTRRPAVILIHGGGWRGGERSSERPVAEALARAGFVALAVDYRLATESASKYPAQLDDVQRAVRWARAHADDLWIDPTRIGAFGHSAGGHLAALLGTRETRANADPALAGYSSRVACVVDTAGPVDFTAPAHPALWPPHQYLITFWLGATLDEAPDRYRDASPLAHVDPDSSPFLILHGTRDEFVPIDQSRRLHAALHAAGVEATLIELDDVHLFQKPENQRRWIDETVRFFTMYLGPSHRQTPGK